MLSGPYFGSTVSVAGLGALVIMLADYGTDYVPPAEGATGRTSCIDYRGVPRDMTMFEGWERGALTRELTRANEPSLYLAALEGRDERRALRFTWVRDRDPTLVVRVEYSADGNAVLYANEGEGRSWRESSGSRRQLVRRLTAIELSQLEHLMNTRRPMESAAAYCDRPLHAGPWVLETLDGRDHQIINQPDPSKAVSEVSFYLLSLTGWDVLPTDVLREGETIRSA